MAAGGSALLVAIGGGTAAVAAMTDGRTTVVTAVAAGQGPAADQAPTADDGPAQAPAGVPGTAEPGEPAADTGLGALPGAADTDDRISGQADRTGTREPRRLAANAAPAAGGTAGAAAPVAPPAGAAPVVTTRTEIETRAIPYRTRLVRDPQLPRGHKRIQTPGAFGEETLRYLVTYADGRRTDRRLVDAQVTREPQHRVVAFGTQRGDGDQGGRHCGPGIGNCPPIGRGAVCPETTTPTPEKAPDGGSLPLGGTLSALDEDLDLMSAEDLGGVELDAGALCKAADEAEAADEAAGRR